MRTIRTPIFLAICGACLGPSLASAASNCATLPSTTASVAALGGAASSEVAAPAGCVWTAFTLDNWITVLPSGPSSGSLNYSVASNEFELAPTLFIPNPSSRSGAIVVRVAGEPDQVLTVSQAGTGCVYSLTPSAKTFPSAGGIGSISIGTNSPLCRFPIPNPNSSFITVQSASWENGSGAVSYSVAANTGASRTGTLEMDGYVVTITQQGPGQNIPAPVSVSPASSSVFAETLAYTFTDPDGWQDLGVLNILINNFLDGRQACYIAFLPTGPTSGTVLLVDDNGNAGGPFQSLTIPGAGSVGNSQCSITGTGSFVSASGNTLTLALATFFSGGFAGNKVINVAARDAASHNSGWQSMGVIGVWNMPPPTGPAVSGVSPARVTAATGTYTFTFTDTNGFLDLAVLNVLVNRFLDGRAGCYVAFVPSGPATGTVLLVNDNGDAGGPFQSMTIPGSGTVQNSQCAINGAGSSVTGSGNSLALTLPITFSPGFTGSQVIYAAARSGGQTSNWQAVGSVTVP